MHNKSCLFMYQRAIEDCSSYGLFLLIIQIIPLLILASNSFCAQKMWIKDQLLFEENFNDGSLDNWICELQYPDKSVVEIQDNKLNIDVGGGATIWFKPKLNGDILIEYDVTVIQKSGPNDRVSDLNQFWMATDPVNSNLFTRSGNFSQYDNLRLYYVGMGGNKNSTTRFRRYPGGGARPLLAEYKDPEHLLIPNTNYHIEIVCYDGLIQYSVNGKVFFTFTDSDPLTKGAFGFRTVRNHETVDNFRVYRLIPSKHSSLNYSSPAYSEFVHPGIAHTMAELDFVHQKVKAGEEPWKSAYEEMKKSKYSDLSWKPKPCEEVERGPYNRPDIGSTELLSDGSAAYTHALQWYITGNPDHAEMTREILNAWSKKLRVIAKHDARLLVGMIGHQYCNAAEIIKHTWDGWLEEEQKLFVSMLRKIFYTTIEDFYPTANGNWDASMIQTMLAMGVFLDDKAMFDRAVNYYLNGDGNGAITMYFNEFGQCQETGRDQAHTQMGLEYLCNSAEIAWKQGVDLYGAADNRLALGFEYTAKYNLGESVHYESYESYRGRYHYKTISAKSRGRFRPIYEKVYNHYHNRMGIEMPYTKKVIDKIRPENGGRSSLPWGTLMFSQQPKDLVISRSLNSPSKLKIEVSSIEDFREVMTKSNQHIVMKPGIYVVTDLLDNKTAFLLSGSNNYFDLSGVTFQILISTLRKMTSKGAHGRTVFRITGNIITLKGGTFENTYDDGMTTVTDFGSYNQNEMYHPSGALNEISVSGDDVKLIDCKLTVRGSFPYGYGNMYGIGRGNVVGLKKHGGIHSTGNRILIDNCYVKMESFCHAIFFTGGDDIVVRNTTVEGGVRPSNELYNETNDGDLANKFDYKLQWPEEVKGLPIPNDHMLNLTEDGIRAYRGAGNVTVENCKVMKMRGGIKLYMAKSATVSNCEVLDCVIQGYSVPSKGTIANCKGNAAYGPLLYVHFDSHSSQHIDLMVLPSSHGLGDHPLAAIKGRSHTIRFTSVDNSIPKILRPIIVGYPLRFDFLCMDYPDVPEGYKERLTKYVENYKATNIKLTNGTYFPVVLGKLSRDNEINSIGPIKDYGFNNTLLKSN